MHLEPLLSAEEHLSAFCALLAWADAVDVATAWISSAGDSGPHWAPLLASTPKMGKVVVGTHFGQTEPLALRTLHEALGPRLRVAVNAQGVFHPKLVAGIHGAERRVLVGSANLTKGAFTVNTEASFLLSGATDEPALSRVVDAIRLWWEAGHAVDEPWLDAYEDFVLRNALTAPEPPRPDPARSNAVAPVQPVPAASAPPTTDRVSGAQEAEDRAAQLLFDYWVRYEEIGPNHPLGYPHRLGPLRPIALRRRRSAYGQNLAGAWGVHEVLGRELWVWGVGPNEVAEVLDRARAHLGLPGVVVTFRAAKNDESPGATDAERAVPAAGGGDLLPEVKGLANRCDRFVITVIGS